MDTTKLAATGDEIDLAIAHAQGVVKVVKLPPVKPRRAQLVYTSGVVNAGRNSGIPQKIG